MDMHSGGGAKLDWEYIYIEASEEEAKNIFFNRFKRNPSKVTCTCCGEDYSLSSEESLAALTEFDGWGSKYSFHGEKMTLEEYMADKNNLFIPAHEIKDEERVADIPKQGYVWVGDDDA